MATNSEKIEIENFTSPGRTYRVNRAKFEAMRSALLTILPEGAPGILFDEAKKRLLPLLPDDLFPGGDKAGWWLKSVQLDLEAKKLITREKTAPLRLFKVV